VTATTGEWMSAEEFRGERRRLHGLVAKRYRQLSNDDVEDIVAEALLASWRYATRPSTQVENPRRWLNAIALHAAAEHIDRDKHADVETFDVTGPIDHDRIATLSAGRQLIADDLTAAEIARKDRLSAARGLVAGLRRIRTLDVEVFLDQTVGELSHAEIAARRGVSDVRVRKAVRRVSKFLAAASGLVQADRLDEQEAMAIALDHARIATPQEHELAQQILARADGVQLYAAITEAMRRGVYLPALLGGEQPARELTAPLTQPEGAPAMWQRITDALTATRHQLVQWATTGKDTATASAAQYLPAGSGVRPGAAIGAALALCIGGATVCVDQGVLPSPLGAAKPKRAPVDQAVKAPKELRAARPAKTAPPPVQTAAPASQPVQRRTSQRSTALPTSSPTSAGGGDGHSNEFGGAASEFGIEGADAGAGGRGGGNEFGGGGSRGGGSGGGGSSGGGSSSDDAAAREFGLP